MILGHHSRWVRNLRGWLRKKTRENAHKAQLACPRLSQKTGDLCRGSWCSSCVDDLGSNSRSFRKSTLEKISDCHHWPWYPWKAPAEIIFQVSGVKIGNHFPDDPIKNISLSLEKEWRYCRRLGWTVGSFLAKPRARRVNLIWLQMEWLEAHWWFPTLCDFAIVLQQQNVAMGSLAQISSCAIRCSWFRQGSGGGFWWRYLLTPEGSGADTLWGSGGFRCRYLVRFRKFPVQLPDEVPEGLGEDAWWGSGRFRCRDLVRFRRVLAEKMLGGVPEGSGADTLWILVRFRRVLVQMLCGIPKGSDVFMAYVSTYFLWHKRLICMAQALLMAKTQKHSSCWG